MTTAAEFAEAHLELLRIRSTRTALIAKIDFVNSDTHKLRRLVALELLRIRRVRAELMAAVDVACCDRHQLRRLVALDRYERYPHTKRRRASVKGVAAARVPEAAREGSIQNAH